MVNAQPSRPGQQPFDDAMRQTGHRPWPVPARPWRLRQRWRDLLFAHWPVPGGELQARLPDGLLADLHDGCAWVGVVPFAMDQVQTRWVGTRTFGVPSTGSFLELNLRTYVRSRRTGRPGVYFFALDCNSPLAVLGARTLFHLPYFPAWMGRTEGADEVIGYSSERRFSREPVRFGAWYRPTGPSPGPSVPGSLEHFLVERYALFTPWRGRMLMGNIHHEAWSLQPAQAEFAHNDLPAAHGIRLPQRAPVLHFSRELYVTLWGLQPE